MDHPSEHRGQTSTPLRRSCALPRVNVCAVTNPTPGETGLKTSRDVIWPGSMPANMDSRAASTLLLREVGPLLTTSVPAPETGPRWADWIVPFQRQLTEHPDLEVARDGDWSDYDHTIRYRIKSGHEFRSGPLNVGILDMFTEGLAEFQALHAEFNLPAGTAYQIGVKGVFDAALFAFGPAAVLTSRARRRYVQPFLDATIREMHAVYEQATSDQPLMFQLEVPAETIFECMVPGPLRRLVTGWLAESVTQIAQLAPPGARFGCHLCLGDLGHRAKGRARTATPLVTLANGIVDRWPNRARTLRYMHLPLAAGDRRPSLDEGYYRPLRNLRMPPQCRIVAGFLHEDLSRSQAETILGAIDSFTAHRQAQPVALAPSCGCGRRSEADTLTVLRQAAALCTAANRSQGAV